MTMADLGPERPSGHASDTRQWGERGRTESEPNVSTRRFLILLALLVVALVVFFLLR
ncbi:MAG: hypothetical protein IPQ07_13630 [Myxococcales bacterium]|nr:hypothetical protein [Myxococcales bacterium]